jgi:predicted metal-dependent peptidase
MNKLIEEKEVNIPGSISYTDFTNIYLNFNFIESELELCRIHEMSHIWLQHHIRGGIFKEKHKNVDHFLLNVAMDYEIAKHIYNDEDEVVLNRKNSRLFHTIKKKDTEMYPNCQYFEEYYFELLKDANRNTRTIDAEHNKCHKDSKNTDGIAKNREVLVKEAKEKSKKIHKKNNIQKHQSLLENYKIKPSLASEIDAIAGRQKISRIKSYRRPARRDGDFFNKGEISKRKTPKITIYVDRSGSFDDTKTMQATQALRKILLKYRGSINHDTLYFNDRLMVKDPIVGSGGTNHQAVVEEIKQSLSQLSIIITDNDDGLSNIPDKLPPIIILPIGCSNTILANKLRVKEVSV